MDMVIYRHFEWDRDKAKLNKIKHGISFKTATAVFDDPNRLDLPDNKHSFDELRRKVIGMADGILFVIYTERSERIRLISARKANDDERSDYYAYGNLCAQSRYPFDGGGTG